MRYTNFVIRIRSKALTMRFDMDCRTYLNTRIIDKYTVQNYLVSMSYDDADRLVREGNLIPIDKRGEMILKHAERALALMQAAKDDVLSRTCLEFCQTIIVENVRHFDFKAGTYISVEPGTVLWDKPWFHPNGYYVYNGTEWVLDGEAEDRNFW